MTKVDGKLFALASLFAVVFGAATAQEPPPAAIRLSQAIAIKTVSYDDVRGTDAEALEAFQLFLQRSYPAAHRVMQREVLAGGSVLYTWPGTEPAAPSILLLAHQDVVPADDHTLTQWRFPPFQGAIADKQVWGRGALDMKGQLISIFEAAEKLAEEGYQPKRSILIALSSDEESKSKGAQAVVKRLSERNVHLEFVLDEGPMALDPFPLTGKPAVFIGVAERGYGTIVLKAIDTAGHSSAPPLHPAVERLARAILEVRKLKFSARVDGLLAETLRELAPDMKGLAHLAASNLWLFEPLLRGELSANPAGAALIGTTSAPTMLSASDKENVMPALATAAINFRFHQRDTPDRVMARVTAAVKKFDVTAEWAAPPDPASPISSRRSGAYLKIVEAARELVPPNTPVAPGLVIGATDGRFFQGLADNVYRFQPIVLTEEEAKTMHGVNERISFENLGRSIAFFQTLIQRASSDTSGQQR